MSNLAIIVLIVILIVVVVAGYVVYKHEHKTPVTPAAPAAVTVTTINVKQSTGWGPATAVYTLDSTGTFYVSGSTTSPACMVIYKDGDFYYGLIDDGATTATVDLKLSQNSSGFYGESIICFNPVGNTVVPANYLAALPLYSSVKPGVNVQATANQGPKSSGNSTTAVSPTSVSGSTITF
jgi:hypothetical protein